MQRTKFTTKDKSYHKRHEILQKGQTTQDKRNHTGQRTPQNTKDTAKGRGQKTLRDGAERKKQDQIQKDII